MTSSVVTSKTNARVKQLRAAFAGQERLSDGLVGIEGEHLLREALRSGISLRTVFVNERLAVPEWVPRGTEVVRLTEEVFRSAVETQAPQGVAALIAPSVRRFGEVMGSSATKGTALILVACGLQDPGNLGTLVRSAEAFEASGVVLAPGTVNAWNQKALRASVGSIFRVPVVTGTLQEVAGLRARGVRLLAAVGEDAEDVIAAQDADLRGACAVMIGNEGSGLAHEWMEIADERVTIPCPGMVESLNAGVAGSLLLYEASRQRGQA